MDNYIPTTADLLIGQALHTGGLSSREKLLLIVIASAADDTQVSHISMDDIALNMGYSPKTNKASLKQLAAKGKVEIIGTDTYKVLLDITRPIPKQDSLTDWH